MKRKTKQWMRKLIDVYTDETINDKIKLGNNHDKFKDISRYCIKELWEYITVLGDASIAETRYCDLLICRHYADRSARWTMIATWLMIATMFIAICGLFLPIKSVDVLDATLQNQNSDVMEMAQKMIPQYMEILKSLE